MKKKACTHCGIVKSTQTGFYYNMKSKDHLDSWCKECKKNYVAEWQHDNRPKVRASAKRRYKERPEINKLYQARYREKHRKEIRQRASAWQSRNKKAVLANCREYQSKKKNAVPKCLSQEHRQQIKLFYMNCPNGHHVDHIIPLRGKNVSGLHVLANLQYLKATDNLKKSNRLL